MTENPARSVLVPQKHGGAIWRGGPANPSAGPGRPKDELRAKLLEIGREKAAPFLAGILEGNVSVTLVGTCEECGHEQKLDRASTAVLLDKVESSIDSRIKAAEQALKYGLGTQKEVSVQNVRERMERTLELIQRVCEPETAKALIEAIRPVWS